MRGMEEGETGERREWIDKVQKKGYECHANSSRPFCKTIINNLATFFFLFFLLFLFFLMFLMFLLFHLFLLFHFFATYYQLPGRGCGNRT